jgi:hypothetical protein
MDATCSSETSIDFHHTALHYVPENVTLQFILCCLNNGKLVLRKRESFRMAE